MNLVELIISYVDVQVVKVTQGLHNFIYQWKMN